MRSYDFEHVIYFDVDDTLIHWDENYTQPVDGGVEITCPHDGQISHHRVHERHVRFLRKQVAKGRGVVVWSAGGVGWAKAVVEALGLSELNIMVLSKPDKAVDDLPDARDIIPNVIYLSEDKYSS
jgi:hydroxymethylpyrimidine pyrophosphatase-like HAD family hydrolase